MNEMSKEDLFSVKKTLTHLRMTKSVKIEFADICFNVPEGRKSSKVILKNVNGKFISGQLTAIMGPSGAGKTTLLNILAGYNCEGMTGNILINDEKRKVEEFCKISRYIMQQDCVEQFLTVDEYMKMAADLKLGSNETNEIKDIMISEILDFLRMTRCRDTKAKNLSGGERKRLSIALELLNNPSVIFLDEPTTGLDDVASSQCVGLMKLLSRGGRTVICVVHTPSAKLFSVFDNVYIMNHGECVYQGCGSSLVPFLDSIGIVCPTSYTPIDFMMDVCSQEYGDFQRIMVSAIQNGLKVMHRENFSGQTKDNLNCQETIDQQENCKDIRDTGSSFSYQVYRLTLRMLLQLHRDKNGIQLRLSIYLYMAVIYSLFFNGVGNDGSKTLYNLGFLFVCLVTFIFCPMMPALLYFPFGVEVLKREHFNKWYGFGAYYISFSLVNTSALIFLTAVFVAIVYTLTDQPIECERIILFFIFVMLTGIVAESIGIIYGSLFNVVNGLFLSTCSAVPPIILAIYGVSGSEKMRPVWIQFTMYFSYLKYSLDGLMYAILHNRSRIPCPDETDFCQYTDVKYFLKDVGVENFVLWMDITALIAFIVIFRVVGYYCLKQRIIPNQLFKTIDVLVKIVKSHVAP